LRRRKAGNRQENAQEIRELKQANMQLQRELNRKEKALAEAAALLVLQKKYRALFEDEA
jgi:transposase-like protein